MRLDCITALSARSDQVAMRIQHTRRSRR